MSLITRLFGAVRSWRRRRAVVKPRQRAEVRLEQLDHRQLLAVNFTGNTVIDFPATKSPGVVVIDDNPSLSPPVVHPLVPNSIKPLVKVSGLDINGIRVTYTAEDDTLSIGLQQPDNQKTGQPVIAGDTDNNLDSATVDPAVLAIEPAFIDFADLGGSETMGAFLDLNNDGTADVVAGISNDIGKPKTYLVADAATSVINPGAIPGFGAALPNNTGNVYLVNDPAHPNFQFSIKNFSQLYQSKTGQPLTAASNFKIGAFGNSNDDDGISEAFFPPQPVNVGQATPPPVCPPLNPPILINPHQGRHINTAHQTNIRVNIFGTSSFDVTRIDPASVRLGGASPVASFVRRIPGYPFPEQTFIFNGLDVDLPRGITTATVTGKLVDGTDFSSSIQVFNRNDSFYPNGAVQLRDRRLGRTSASSSALDAMAADVAASGGAQSMGAMSAVGTLKKVGAAHHASTTVSIAPAPEPVAAVSIPKRQKLVTKATARRHVAPTMNTRAFVATSAPSAPAATAY